MHQRSSVGNLLDSVKTSTLIFLMLVGIFIAALAFYFLSASGQGIESTFDKKSVIGFLDAIYFSFVTVSSLGYGDYRPVGLGRLVAIIEVVYGLVFLAIIVSKLASERTSTLIKLVYASDTQRRLLEFIESTRERNDEAKHAIVDHDYFSVSDLALKNKTALATYKHFINYHFKYGDIGNDWDEKQVVRLIKVVGESAEIANNVIRKMQTDSDLHIRIQNYLDRAVNLSEHISEHYKNERILSIHKHILSQRKGFLASLENSGGNYGVLQGKSTGFISSNLLKRVEKELPQRPWPDHVHKLVAKELRISNKMANKAISMLLEQGLFPSKEH